MHIFHFPVPTTTPHPPTRPGASHSGSWLGRAPAARAPYPPRHPTHRCTRARRVVVPGQGAYLRRAPRTHRDTPPTDAPGRVVRWFLSRARTCGRTNRDTPPTNAPGRVVWWFLGRARTCGRTHRDTPPTNAPGRVVWWFLVRARTCGARPVPTTTPHPPMHPGASCGCSRVGRAPAARAPYPPRHPTHRIPQARRVVVPGQGRVWTKSPLFAQKVDFFAQFSPKNRLFPGTKGPPRPVKNIEKTTFPRPFTRY